MSKATRLRGGYYLAGGLWPLIHFRSFEDVTGPKPDRIVTEIAPALYVAIGTSLLTAGQPREAFANPGAADCCGECGVGSATPSCGKAYLRG